MEIYNLFNLRSGHGKTTGVVILAELLAKKNKRVLVIDLGDTPDASDYYSHAGISSKLYDPSIKQLLDASNPAASDYINHTTNRYIDYIAGYAGPISVAADNRYNLAAVIGQIKHEYDYCLIDGGTGSDSCTECGLLASDVVYIPMCCDSRGIYSVQQSLAQIQGIQHNGNLIVAGCYISQCSAVNKSQYDAVKSQMGDMLLPVIIPDDGEYVDSIIIGTQAIDVDNPVVIAYGVLADLILSENNSNVVDVIHHALNIMVGYIQ